jgi:hypothetical protein
MSGFMFAAFIDAAVARGLSTHRFSVDRSTASRMWVIGLTTVIIPSPGKGTPANWLILDT